MTTSANLMWNVLFGSIGLGYCVYGRKELRGVALACGVALCVFPFFVSNTLLMIATGVGLMALPFFIRY